MSDDLWQVSLKDYKLGQFDKAGTIMLNKKCLSVQDPTIRISGAFAEPYIIL